MVSVLVATQFSNCQQKKDLKKNIVFNFFLFRFPEDAGWGKFLLWFGRWFVWQSAFGWRYSVSSDSLIWKLPSHWTFSGDISWMYFNLETSISLDVLRWHFWIIFQSGNVHFIGCFQVTFYLNLEASISLDVLRLHLWSLLSKVSSCDLEVKTGDSCPRCFGLISLCYLLNGGHTIYYLLYSLSSLCFFFSQCDS